MNTQMLRNILEAIMTINVSGNDVVTLSNCMQALQQLIVETEAQATSMSESTKEADAE